MYSIFFSSNHKYTIRIQILRIIKTIKKTYIQYVSRHSILVFFSIHNKSHRRLWTNAHQLWRTNTQGLLTNMIMCSTICPRIFSKLSVVCCPSTRNWARDQKFECSEQLASEICPICPETSVDTYCRLLRPYFTLNSPNFRFLRAS